MLQLTFITVCHKVGKAQAVIITELIIIITVPSYKTGHAKFHPSY